MSDNQFARRPTSITELPKKGDLLLISDQQKDGIKITGSTIATSSFLRLGLMNAEFTDCDFTQSNFEDSYFRKAKFKNVRLTGSTFRFCNFDKAIFQGCDLRYCSFYHCKLPCDEMIACLPREPKLRRDLARNLRVNYEMLGDMKSADVFLDIEITADDEEQKSILFSKSSYYKERYNIPSRINAGIKFCVSKISGLVWGYGRRVSRLLFSFIFITAICSFITFSLGIHFSEVGQTTPHLLSLWESIYFTFGVTLGMSSGASLVPITFLGKLLVLFENFLGTLFLALLAATLYRRIAR